MNKITNTKTVSTIEVNDITATLVPTEQGFKLVVTGNLDIELNNELIYSATYEDPNYKYIPLTMRDFIKSKTIESMEYDPIEKRLAVDFDVSTNSDYESVSIYFPLDQSKEIKARLDGIMPLHLLSDFIDGRFPQKEKRAEIKAHLASHWDSMVAEIKTLGFQLAFSHSANWGVDGWHDISFYAKDWNQENFTKAITSWNTFNQWFKNENRKLKLK